MENRGNHTYRSIQNGVTVTLGGSTPDKFVPNLNFSKWNDEYFWNLNLPVTVATERENWGDGRIDITLGGWVHVFYERNQDEIEYEIILDKRPPRNYVDFNLTCRPGVRFFPQLDLTRQWKQISQHRNVTLEEYLATHRMPERAIDSIAIYQLDKANNDYQVGKIGHIYRPQFTDALGHQIWGSWELRDNDTVLRMSVDANWLRDATYPVTIDPTFGNTAYGVATMGCDASMLCGLACAAPGSTGTGDSITVRCATYTATTHFKGVLIDHTGSDALVTNGVGGAYTIPDETEGWYTSTFGTAPTITSGNVYYPSTIFDQGNVYINADYTGTTYPTDWYGRQDSTNSYTTPAAPGTWTEEEHRVSIYCTYTAGGGATIDQEGFRFRNDDGSESAATWKDSQDTNITLAAGSTLRIRYLLNATGDLASKTFQLEYRHKKSGSSFGAYKKISS